MAGTVIINKSGKHSIKITKDLYTSLQNEYQKIFIAQKEGICYIYSPSPFVQNGVIALGSKLGKRSIEVINYTPLSYLPKTFDIEFIEENTYQFIKNGEIVDYPIKTYRVNELTNESEAIGAEEEKSIVHGISQTDSE